MKHSESIAKLAVALVAAQSELRAIPKDATNPHYKSKYASLDSVVETVRPVLAKHGLAVVQGATVPETGAEGKLVGFAVETMLIHLSGEWVTNIAVVPVAKPDAQGAGGALTYGRRYGLSALLSLATDEDDDGHAASRKTASAAQRSVPAVRTNTGGQASPVSESAGAHGPASARTASPSGTRGMNDEERLAWAMSFPLRVRGEHANKPLGEVPSDVLHKVLAYSKDQAQVDAATMVLADRKQTETAHANGGAELALNDARPALSTEIKD